MAETGSFKRSLSLLDLTLLGFGAIFGSGWLFAASHVAAMAGPAGILAWLGGGIAVFFLGLVYCELAAALPEAGGIVRYPARTHGPLLGALLGFVTLLAYSSLTSLEIIAARQYLGSWVPGLTRNGAGDPTLMGWLLQFVVLTLMMKLNMSKITVFALFNNIITIFKFLVPALVIVFLLAYVHPANYTSHGFAPFGMGRLETAISTGGVIFAYLGLTPIIAVAGEAKSPQRTIPLALIFSVLMAAAVYVLLQGAFIGAVPPAMLEEGWAQVGRTLSLPFHDLAVVLGLGWLAKAVIVDAVVSPSGTGNIYMGASARILYAWARTGTLSRWFLKLDPESGTPRRAVFVTFLMTIFWTLPFPSWDALIGVVSSALVMSYAFAPVAAGALRNCAPDISRPFRVPFFSFASPFAFMLATLIIYWTGKAILTGLLSVQLIFLFLAAGAYAFSQGTSIWKELRHCWWVIGYFVGLLVLAWCGSFGGASLLPAPYDDIATALFSLVIYFWGVRQFCEMEDLTQEEHIILEAQAGAISGTVGLT
ncbi:APC family permease [Acetobacter conturbans]|uniref:Amino acid permease n=1 Tax=Acetobacter conturbans TaxID=1737472 RepID=A0ABX0K351_9PROT|nr:APC family permease [Acetobacter conturbans]NHN89569.1 amino acid permease [Acetobacter conturbans]